MLQSVNIIRLRKIFFYIIGSWIGRNRSPSSSSEWWSRNFKTKQKQFTSRRFLCTDAKKCSHTL